MGMGMLRGWGGLAATFLFTATLSLTAGHTARGAAFTVTNTLDSGPGSLRQAVLDADASVGLDIITFSIPGPAPHTIALFSSVDITDPVIIDATTQPGFAGTPVVELVGFAMAPPGPALVITSGGSTVRGLAIGGFDTAISINGGAAGGNVIAGDYIGTDFTGELARFNFRGIVITELSGNKIGGTNAADRNVISANYTGILTIRHTINNVIQGNFIGTDATGSLPLGNNDGIVFLAGFTTNRVGGTAPGAGNVIAANHNDGIEFNGSAGNNTQGNWIGTNQTGAAGLGNGNNGIFVNFGCCNQIGGTSPAARNVISGNGGDGILISHPFFGTTVRGNWIGLSTSGSALGNAHYGIDIHATNPLDVAGQGDSLLANVISANAAAGGSAIRMTEGANRTVVQGNLVGTDPSGTAPVGNFGDGVIVDGAPRTTIGGPGAGNTIAFNAGAGVNVLSGNGASISENSIFANGGLGIDLAPAGVTPDDRRDGDIGANDLQNFPDLKSAPSTGTSGSVHGILDSVPNSAFRIEIYVNASCDPSGNGEGRTLVGIVDVTTSNGGIAPFNVPATFAPGDYLTATATDVNGSTSEFSGCLQATAAD